jgi:hypothetical protein
MTKSKTKSIETAIAKWDKEHTIADFVKNELAQVDLDTKKTKGASVLDRLYKMTATAELDSDRIKAIELILKTAAGNESKSPAVQVNQQFNLGTWAESLE